MDLLIIALLFFGTGFVAGRKVFLGERKKDEFSDFGNGKENPLFLRNGFGITKEENPTFAEQWINILNYCGESQKEGDYEETEGDYAEDYLG